VGHRCVWEGVGRHADTSVRAFLCLPAQTCGGSHCVYLSAYELLFFCARQCVRCAHCCRVNNKFVPRGTSSADTWMRRQWLQYTNKFDTSRDKLSRCATRQSRLGLVVEALYELLLLRLYRHAHPHKGTYTPLRGFRDYCSIRAITILIRCQWLEWVLGVKAGMVVRMCCVVGEVGRMWGLVSKSGWFVHKNVIFVYPVKIVVHFLHKNLFITLIFCNFVA
jgi:hypothetical protein